MEKKKIRITKKFLIVSAIFLFVAIVVFFYLIFYPKYLDGFNQNEDRVSAHDIAKINIDPRLFDFGLYIPKISVAVPIVANVDGTNKTAYNKALLSGVAHYRGTALPGENSNIFIFGHSSTWNGVGDYAEAFAHLNDLERDDQIIIYRQQKENKYLVSKKEIVAADDLSWLEPTKSEQLILMTCWPIGSNLKRLVVIAKLDS